MVHQTLLLQSNQSIVLAASRLRRKSVNAPPGKYTHISWLAIGDTAGFIRTQNSCESEGRPSNIGHARKREDFEIMRLSRLHHLNSTCSTFLKSCYMSYFDLAASTLCSWSTFLGPAVDVHVALAVGCG